MNGSRSKFWGFIGGNIVPLMTVLAGVIAIMFQALAKLTDSVVLAVILGLLCLLATQEIIERSKKLEHIEELIQKNLDTVSSIGSQERIRILNGADEWYPYLTMRMLQAKKSIDDTGLAPRTWTGDSRLKRDYYARREEIIASGRVRNRYVAVFYDNDRLDMVERFLTEYGASKGYFASYYPNILQNRVPMLSFCIIDDEEVVVGFYHSPYTLGEKDQGLVIQNPEIVHVFMDYYNFLWRESIKLNDKAGSNIAALTEIRHQLTQGKPERQITL